MATEASGDARCGIGARLRSARERSGLTILQAAEKVHADPRVLEALEAERFEEFGAPVFVRGHIRRYAELVRENPTELQDLYSASTHAGARPDLTRIPHTSGARPPDAGLLIPGLIMVIGVGLVGIIWWFITSLRTPAPLTADQPERVESAPTAADSRQPMPLNTPTPPVVSTTGGANDRAAANRAASGRASANAGSASNAAGSRASPNASAAGANTRANTSNLTAGSPSSAAPTGGANPSGQQQAGAQEGQGSASTNSASPIGAATSLAGTTSNSSDPSGTASPDAASSSAPATNAATPPARTANSNELTLRFSGDSWAEIYDSRGNRLFYDIGSADSVKTLSGSPPWRVVLGNPGGVAVEVNGKSAPVPKVRGGESGIQFTINQSGRVSKARATSNAGG